MQRSIIVSICLVLFAVVSCAFIPRSDRATFKEYEKSKYTLLKDVIVNGELALKKGDVVAIRIEVTSDWIKVYGYSEKEEELSAKLSLILYLFDSNFKDKTFTFNEFDSQLYAVLQRK